MPRLSHDEFVRFLDVDVDHDRHHVDDRDRFRGQRPAAPPARRQGGDGGPSAATPRQRPHARPHERKPFRCGRCRQMVEPPPSGGRHRNHCPFCLTSRHVDRRRPGDRESDCRALMAPVGTTFRPDGEQLVVHRCNGCGALRRCRVAADDAAAMLLRLPPFVAADADADEAPADAIA